MHAVWHETRIALDYRSVIRAAASSLCRGWSRELISNGLAQVGLLPAVELLIGAQVDLRRALTRMLLALRVPDEKSREGDGAPHLIHRLNGSGRQAAEQVSSLRPRVGCVDPQLAVSEGVADVGILRPAKVLAEQIEPERR